ncbi:hypothetical protein [Mycoplasmopsis cricetuli]|uniref:hypothetical protein n=1 Tax=Mycoplasmopsis cricetuli TaxID=171283 RepID=UPI00046EAA95|nr:hypothetical protein [Mycoplasmopsis cricetuli]
MNILKNKNDEILTLLKNKTETQIKEFTKKLENLIQKIIKHKFNKDVKIQIDFDLNQGKITIVNLNGIVVSDDLFDKYIKENIDYKILFLPFTNDRNFYLNTLVEGSQIDISVTLDEISESFFYDIQVGIFNFLTENNN